MKKIIFSLLSVVLVLASCGDSARDVNKVIMTQLQEVADKMEIISHNISEDDYDGANASIDSLTAKVNEAEKVIAALSNRKAAAYRQSALEYLAYIKQDAASTFGKAIDMFKVAKAREMEDVAGGKQSPNLINSGPDFDAARKVVKDFMKTLRKNQETVIERQEKFLKNNHIQ
jgi:polyhydroxyalkanoate synthesis regulator phasin